MMRHPLTMPPASLRCTTTVIWVPTRRFVLNCRPVPADSPEDGEAFTGEAWGSPFGMMAHRPGGNWRTPIRPAWEGRKRWPGMMLVT